MNGCAAATSFLKMSIVRRNAGGLNATLGFRRPALNRMTRMGFARSVATAARQRAGRLFTQMGRRQKFQSGHSASTYHDQRFVYRKKRMPPRRRRQWKRFKNKVLAVSEKDLGTRTHLFNAAYTWTNTTATSNGIANVGLYTWRVGGTTPYADLAYIANAENTSDPTAAAGSTVDKSTKFIFKSAILDVTITNASGMSNGSVFSPDSRGILELDIYEVTASKDLQDGASVFADLTNAMATAASNTKKIGGAGTAITYTGGNLAGGGSANCTRGSTPWDLPLALSQFGIKIWKKRKYFIPNQQTITYQVRDAKRHVLVQEDMLETSGGNKPKLTRWLFITYKLVPGLTIGAVGTAGNWQESIVVGQTRKYFYKVEGINEDRHVVDTV